VRLATALLLTHSSFQTRKPNRRAEIALIVSLKAEPKPTIDSGPAEGTIGGIMKGFQTAVAVSGSGRRRHVATEDFHHQRECAVASVRLSARWPQFRAALWILAVAMSMLSRGVVPARAQESSAQGTSEIAKQAQNPIASVVSVPLENDFYPHTGIDKGDSYVLELKPVVPFKLSSDWNLITRTVIPIIQVPDLSPSVNGTRCPIFRRA